MEHAVIAHIRMTEDQFGSRGEQNAIAVLVGELEKVIDNHKVGEFDGEEFGGGRCVLYMYGPDADLLFEVVKPVLEAAPLTKGGFVIRRYGAASDRNAKEERISL